MNKYWREEWGALEISAGLCDWAGEHFFHLSMGAPEGGYPVLPPQLLPTARKDDSLPPARTMAVLVLLSAPFPSDMRVSKPHARQATRAGHSRCDPRPRCGPLCLRLLQDFCCSRLQASHCSLPELCPVGCPPHAATAPDRSSGCLASIVSGLHALPSLGPSTGAPRCVSTGEHASGKRPDVWT